MEFQRIRGVVGESEGFHLEAVEDTVGAERGRGELFIGSGRFDSAVVSSASRSMPK